jgi:hypothetical protein
VGVGVGVAPAIVGVGVGVAPGVPPPKPAIKPGTLQLHAPHAAREMRATSGAMRCAWRKKRRVLSMFVILN